MNRFRVTELYNLEYEDLPKNIIRGCKELADDLLSMSEDELSIFLLDRLYQSVLYLSEKDTVTGQSVEINFINDVDPFKKAHIIIAENLFIGVRAKTDLDTKYLEQKEKEIKRWLEGIEDVVNEFFF